MVSFIKTHPLLKIVNGALKDLPSPSALNIIWNFGSLLGVCLIVQIITGLFLAIHYRADTSISFATVRHIGRDVNIGWLLRAIHANGARAFFFALYLHLGRGLYYSSYRHSAVWALGVVLLLLVIATAFIGYVLPWGQISFWGATVITNLFSAIPYVGGDIVYWIWGGFAVDNATLTRFFAFHFLLPMLTVAAAGVHLLFLHQTGSSNPLGLRLDADKVPFHPYFSVKDLGGFVVYFLILVFIALEAPWALGDPENFLPANPLVTPVHIQPEWYFLFAYAILRSIPNKLGGVIALAGAVAIFFVMPLYPKRKFQRVNFYPVSKLALWGFFSVSLLLTWIGACPVEDPYILVGQILTVTYFRFFIITPLLFVAWDFTTTYCKK